MFPKIHLLKIEVGKLKKITFIGTGYVGLVSGAAISDFGHRVICADISKEKLDH